MITNNITKGKYVPWLVNLRSEKRMPRFKYDHKINKAISKKSNLEANLKTCDVFIQLCGNA